MHAALLHRLLPCALLPLVLITKFTSTSIVATTSMAPKRNYGEGKAAGAAARKSKKHAVTVSASTATDLKKGEGDWTTSSVKEATLTKLRNEGFLPSADRLLVCAPSSKDVLPELRDNELVLFVESV